MHSNNQSNAPDSKEKILQWVGKYLQSKNNVSQNVIETLSLDLENHYWSLVQSIQTYIWNKTWKISTEVTFKDIEWIDRNTINEELIPFKVLTQNSILTFNPQAKVYITDNETGEMYSGFPSKKRLNEDDELSDEPNQEWIMLTNPSWESKYFPFTVITNEYCIDTTRYTIQQTPSEKSHNPLSEAVLLHMIKDKCVTLDEFEISDQTNILDNAATPLPHHKSDTESILQAWSHPRHTKNKKNASPFTGYEFSHYSQIPEAVKKEMEERKIKTPKARIYQWIISFNKDYFCEKYWISDIERKNTDTWKQLIFSFPDNVKRTVWEMYADEKTKGCIKEMIATKTHEITHRLLHFHWLHTLKVPTIEWKKVIVDQEFLCEVADRESRLREKTENGTYFVRYHDGKKEHTIYCDALEDYIAKKIKWFTRQNIKWLDIQQLDHYLKQCWRFDTLAATNAAGNAAPSNSSASPTTTPLTEQQIKQYTPIRKKRIDKYINDQWLRLNLNNAQEKKKFDDILTLKDKITDIEAKLASGTPLTPDELTDAQETHQAVSDFFHPPQTTIAPTGNNNPNGVESREQDDGDDDDDEVQWSASSDDEVQWSVMSYDSKETIDHKQFEKDFVSVLAKDGSESWVKLESGTVIFLKDTLSTTPWYGHNRVKYVITGIWEDTISLRMEDSTENNVAWSKVFTMPKTQETINKIAKIGKQSTLLFKKTQKNNFTKKIGDFAGWQRSKIGSDFTKSYTDKWETKKWPITHVGSIKGKITWLDKTENVIYKVERWFNKVTVTGQVNKKDISKDDKQKKELRTKQMDFDTFMVFCKTKWLLPYNEQEVKRAWISVDPSKIPESEISRKDKLVSLWAVWNFLKAIPENIKKKIDEEQEFQTAEAKTRWWKWLAKIPWFEEIGNEIWGMDGVIWQKIQKYKGDRSGGGEKSDVHDVPIFEWMRDALFLNPSNRRNFKYQAASWLLYALEKWSLYPRALAPYANKDWWWYWIKIILWDEMHQQFLKQRQIMIDQWRSQWLKNDDNFYDRLVKYELEFIQQATTDKPFWWSKFWREVEWHKDKLFWWADSIDPWWIAAKGNFDAMYEAFLWWWIKWNNPKTLFSALKAMEWAIETDSDLNLFYQCILLIFVTGIVHILPNDYRNKLAGIGRAKWIPVALFASNTYASGKVVRLLDHIAKNSWMRSFSDYCGSSQEDFDNKHVGNYAQIIGEDKDWNPVTAQQELTNNFKDWWASAWDVIINGFAPGENLLKTKKYPDGWDVPSKTKDVVASYLGEWWIFNDYLWNQGDDYLRNADAQTPIFQKNLMNLSKWPLKSVLWLSWKSLQINADETTQQMRKNFVQIIWWYDTTLKSIDPETIEPMMSFLYGKYMQMFGDKLSGRYNKSTYKNNLEEAMISWWTTWMSTLRTVVKNGIIGEKTKAQQRQQQLMNPDFEDVVLRADIWLQIAQDWVYAFSDLLFKWMEWLSKDMKERIIKTGNKFSGSE